MGVRLVRIPRARNHHLYITEIVADRAVRLCFLGGGFAALAADDEEEDYGEDEEQTGARPS